jgi:hypothetical protein
MCAYTRLCPGHIPVPANAGQISYIRRGNDSFHAAANFFSQEIKTKESLMKKMIILSILLNASIAMSSSNWDTMIWDQDNWYKGQSQITGQVVTHVTGQEAGVLNASVSIIELNKNVQSDANGEFSFMEIPDGTYTITIETDYFAMMQLNAVTIKDGQASLPVIELFDQKNRYSQEELDQLLDEEQQKWDVDKDGQIGLKEAIKALKISSGFSN